MDSAEMLIPIAMFAMIFGIVYIIVRKKERMALMEKGADASIFYTKPKTTPALKWGMLCLGVGLGILVGKILEATTVLGEEVAFFSMIFIFGGISLVIYYFIEKQLGRKSE